MSKAVKPILDKARRLSDQDKLAVVNGLLEELDRPDPAIEKAWVAECRRRQGLIRQGRMKTLSYAQVFGPRKTR